jgi:hypothetical protein
VTIIHGLLSSLVGHDVEECNARTASCGAFRSDGEGPTMRS